jgi:GWxTD domain-containing protein
MRRFALAALVLSSVAALAAPSAKFVDWGKGPAQWLMTKDEAAKWKTVNDDVAAQAFVDLFWARRDPSPGTPVNEMRDEFDKRVAYADQHFPQGRTKGSMTDRGHVLIVLGPPTKLDRTSPAPTSTILTPQQSTNSATLGGANGNLESLQSYSPKQLWTYDATKTRVPLGAPLAEIAFVDQYGSNEWKLERTNKTDIVGLLARANDAVIVQPSLTEAPAAAPEQGAVQSVAQGVAAPAGAAAATATEAATELKTESLRNALADLKAGKSSYKNLYVTYTESITPQGDYFVPLALYVPKVAGLSATQDLVFFGEVDDASGKPVTVFEEPAKLTATRDDYFFDKSLKLAPGKYKATFGLAENGKPLSMTTTDLDLATLDKDASTMSRLILSNNVYPMPAAQKPTDPFAFGGIKVVPKADRTFKNSDELWYFFELRNPAVDETSKKPKIQARVQLSGTTADGKKVKMDGPMSDMDATELLGVPGHFAVGASIPLESFKPGTYTLKIKAVDTIKKQPYDLEQGFTISGDK